MPAADVPGSWSCKSAAGTRVDCSLGQVRHASWTPSQPLPPPPAGERYGVFFNPEHVLDVTDMAGNPLLAAFTFTAAG